MKKTMLGLIVWCIMLVLSNVRAATGDYEAKLAVASYQPSYSIQSIVAMLRQRSPIKNKKYISTYSGARWQMMENGTCYGAWFDIGKEYEHDLWMVNGDKTSLKPLFRHTFSGFADIVPGTEGGTYLVRSGNSLMRVEEKLGKVLHQLYELHPYALTLATNASASHVVGYDYQKDKLFVRDLRNRQVMQWSFNAKNVYALQVTLSCDANFLAYWSSPSVHASGSQLVLLKFSGSQPVMKILEREPLSMRISNAAPLMVTDARTKRSEVSSLLTVLHPNTGQEYVYVYRWSLPEGLLSRQLLFACNPYGDPKPALHMQWNRSSRCYDIACADLLKKQCTLYRVTDTMRKEAIVSIKGDIVRLFLGEGNNFCVMSSLRGQRGAPADFMAFFTKDQRNEC